MDTKKPLVLGVFSVSLKVKDLAKSKEFYEKLGFSSMGGDVKQNYLIMKNGRTLIGLFQGFIDENVLTFNPGDWVEFLIPLTIVLTSLDNILMKNRQKTLMKLNYYLALFFGLIHGMGFANTVRVMLAKEQSIFVPLLGFNIGLELGQILVVVIILVLLFILLNLFKINRKDWILFVSSAVFALSLKMTLERLPF